LELVRSPLQCFEPAQASALVFQFPLLTPKKRGHKWVAFNYPSLLPASGSVKVFIVCTLFVAVFPNPISAWHGTRCNGIFFITPRPQRPPLAIVADSGISTDIYQFIAVKVKQLSGCTASSTKANLGQIKV
jgi:hypothetical protein